MGDGKPLRISTPPANDGNPSWSRDGRWIYFDSMRSGERRVWKIPANGGNVSQITQDGGFAPVESPDGKFIYYSQFQYGTQPWRIPVEGGQATKVFEPVNSYQALVIADSGAYFLRPRQGETGPSIQFLSFATNQIRVANLEIKSLLLGPTGGLDVSPDGQSILLYTRVDQQNTELMLM